MKWPLPEFVKEWPDFIEDFQMGKVEKKEREGEQCLPRSGAA